MRNNLFLAICVGALTLMLAACGEPQETATAAQTFGPSPSLPPPQHSWIPTVDIASVNRWPDGARPTAANGMTVNAFATGLDHPRTVYVLPNGDVLVAESNAPPKPDDGKGIRGFIYKEAQSWAGAEVTMTLVARWLLHRRLRGPYLTRINPRPTALPPKGSAK